MKKNAPYLILFSFLLMAVAFLFFQNKKSNTSTKDIKIEEVKEIHEVIMEDRYGEKIHLIKKKNVWYSGNFEAQTYLVQTVLETVNKWSVESILSNERKGQAIDDIRKSGIKITLKNEDGDIIKAYHLGSGFKGLGNFMLIEQDGIVLDQPLLIKYPTFKGDLQYRFKIDSNLWKSTVAIETSIDYIQKISVKYPQNIAQSFDLFKDEELIKVVSVLEPNKPKSNLNKSNVVAFLLALENLHFERFIYDSSIQDFIKTAPKYATIELVEIDGKKQQVWLYRIPSDPLNPYLDVKGQPIPYNLDKFYAYLPLKKVFATAQFYNFGPVLKDYNFFFSPQ
jgi:hypothetical protein